MTIEPRRPLPVHGTPHRHLRTRRPRQDGARRFRADGALRTRRRHRFRYRQAKVAVGDEGEKFYSLLPLSWLWLPPKRSES